MSVNKITFESQNGEVKIEEDYFDLAFEFANFRVEYRHDTGGVTVYGYGEPNAKTGLRWHPICGTGPS